MTTQTLDQRPRQFLVRELLMPSPPKSPAGQEALEKFRSAHPRPLNRKEPRGRLVDGRNADDVMAGLRAKYAAGPLRVRSMNVGPAEPRDRARAVVIVYLHQRTRRSG